MPPTKITRDQLLGDFDTFLFDADGVLWTGDIPVPGAIQFIDLLLSLPDKKVFIITNNSTKTLQQYQEKIRKIGFGAVKEENIISPAIVLAEYLKENKDRYFNQQVYLIGTESLKNTLEKEAGVKVFGTGPDHLESYTDGVFINDIDRSVIPRAVICSFDSHFSYPKIMKAANYLSHPEVEFLITNEDYTFPGPVPGVIVPGSGATSASVKAVSGRTPKIFGKPHNQMAEFLARRVKVDPVRTIMFGDRLDTDIMFGNNNGFSSCWMSTGISSIEDVKKAEAAGDVHLVPKFTHNFSDYV